ncbi:hypothetical protein V1524DRAFT_479439 [Lipomyces starkeyi]
MDYDEMLSHEGLQAVVLATMTAVHAEQAIKAIAADKHALSEKPLSTSDEISQKVVDAATKKPHLKVMCGFSRRFDASYQYFGEENIVKSIYAAGVTAIEPGLRQHNDCDNAVGIVEFYSGQIAYFYVTRMMAVGQEDQSLLYYHRTQGWVSVAFLLIYMVTFGASWASAMGDAIRNLSIIATCQRSRTVNLLELIKQFYYWPYSSTACSEYGLRCMDHVFKDNSAQQDAARKQVIEADLIRKLN